MIPDAVRATAERAWRELRAIADGSTPDENIGREWARSLVMSYDAMRATYEMKVQDLQQETHRCSRLQFALDNERQSVKELWEIVEDAKAKKRAAPEGTAR